MRLDGLWGDGGFGGDPSSRSYQFGELGSGSYGLGTDYSASVLAPSGDAGSLRFGGIDPRSVGYGNNWDNVSPVWQSGAGQDMYSPGTVMPFGGMRTINGPAIGYPYPETLPTGASTTPMTDATGRLFFQVNAPGVNVLTAYDPNAVAPTIPQRGEFDSVTVTGKHMSAAMYELNEMGAGFMDGLATAGPGLLNAGLMVADGYRLGAAMMTGNGANFVPYSSSTGKVTFSGLLGGVVEMSPMGILGNMGMGNYRGAGGGLAGNVVGLGLGGGLSYAGRLPVLGSSVSQLGRNSWEFLAAPRALSPAAIEAGGLSMARDFSMLPPPAKGMVQRAMDSLVYSDANRVAKYWGDLNGNEYAAIRGNIGRTEAGQKVLAAADNRAFVLNLTNDLPPSPYLMGEASGSGRYAKIYLQNTENGNLYAKVGRYADGLEYTSNVALHEGLHSLGVRGSRRAEALVRLEELRSMGVPVDRTAMRQVLWDMGSTPKSRSRPLAEQSSYDQLRWTNRRTTVNFPGLEF